MQKNKVQVLQPEHLTPEILLRKMVDEGSVKEFKNIVVVGTDKDGKTIGWATQMQIQDHIVLAYYHNDIVYQFWNEEQT